MNITRRDFLKATAIFAAAQTLPSCAHSQKNIFGMRSSLQNITPIQAVNGFNTVDFTGDNIGLPHDVLWDKEGFIKSAGGIPDYEKHVDVVVVGGGMSGLLSTYFLKDRNVLMLEQDAVIGGNSKGEILSNATYSIGAAYIVKPTDGSLIQKTLSDLGLDSQMRLEHEGVVYQGGALKAPFWSGATDLAQKKKFVKFAEHILKISETAYPDVPWTNESALTQSQTIALDAITFGQWLKKHHPDIHPHIEEYLELYAWSSFGGGIDEISAAQMLNYIAGEVEGIVALPGGNASIAQALLQKIISRNNVEIRTQALACDVRSVNEGVAITYVDARRKLHRVLANKCIFAAPKFVAKRVIEGLAEDQLKAMNSVKYRAYIVANVILNSQKPSPSFELYCLRGKRPELPNMSNLYTRELTDLCFGTWAAFDKTDKRVLTVYKALPFDGHRQLLFNPALHDKLKNQVSGAIEKMLGEIGFEGEKISGIRMTRWGHALPLAQPGQIHPQFTDVLNRPVAGKIFFANQDNYVNPCFETAIAVAEEVTQKIV